MTTKKNAAGRIEAAEGRTILHLIDQAYNRKAWHGVNLRGSLRGVDAVTADRCPDTDRPSIWATVLHVAYIKYSVWRRLTGARSGSFPYRTITGTQWCRLPDDRSEESWKESKGILNDYHHRFREAAAETLARSRDIASIRRLDDIIGISMHDVYHAAQIQLVKRLVAGSTRTDPA